jgi:hypothetical protein
MMTKKQQLDKNISKHADDLFAFTVISDQLGVLDLMTTVGDLFSSISLVYLDDSIKKHMKFGKLYEYSQSAFKGACEPEPMYMFKAGVDPESEDLFNFEDKPYDHTMCYAFPISKLEEWMANSEAAEEDDEEPKQPIVIKYQLPEDFDMEELTDMLEEGMDPVELEKWLIDNGAEPLVEE